MEQCCAPATHEACALLILVKESAAVAPTHVSASARASRSLYLSAVPLQNNHAVLLKVKVEDKLHGDLVYCFGGRCGWMERTEQSCRQLPGRQSTACKEASGPHLGQVGATYALVPLVLPLLQSTRNVAQKASSIMYYIQQQDYCGLGEDSWQVCVCSRGSWWSRSTDKCVLHRAGDLRRALASTERLCIVMGDEGAFELRDVAALYLHAGDLPAAVTHLNAYAKSSAAKGDPTSIL